MLRKTVSLGNLGGPLQIPSPIADLAGDTTSDGYANLSFLEDTNTPWVRLMVTWNFFWPNPPLASQSSGKYGYPAPRPSPSNPNNVPQVNAQLFDLDANLYLAKTATVTVNGKQTPAPRKVILTIFQGYPKWLNGTEPASNTESANTCENAVLPPDNVLMMPTRKPPNGTAFQPTDFMYSRWIHFLIFRYHPRNQFRRSPTDLDEFGFPFKDIWIDALELVNEPNLSNPAGTTFPNGKKKSGLIPVAESTARMMLTAQSVKTDLNNRFRKSGVGIKLLGPASAGLDPKNGFARDVIKRMVRMNRGKPIHDRDFGWSHHNYEDMQQIAVTIARLGPFLELLGPVAQFASLFYGGGTQNLRNILTGKWLGWGERGSRGSFDTDPFIFLTEGGGRLDSLDHALGLSTSVPDVNTDSAHRGSSLENRLKQLQRYCVGGTADALLGGAGRGVEMFTNFLFFDNAFAAGQPPGTHFLTNLSGLCDEYGLGTTPLTLDETAVDYERPAYGAWKKFGL